MSSFTKLDKVKFELSCVLTWGVKKDKHKGYSVPIVPDIDTAAKISELATENDAKSPLYGAYDTLYLRSNSLSQKQNKELLDKGRSYVLVNFELEGINTSKSVRYLSFRVTKLRKTECDTDNDTPPEIHITRQHYTKDTMSLVC